MMVKTHGSIPSNPSSLEAPPLFFERTASDAKSSSRSCPVISPYPLRLQSRLLISLFEIPFSLLHLTSLPFGPIKRVGERHLIMYSRIRVSVSYLSASSEPLEFVIN